MHSEGKGHRFESCRVHHPLFQDIEIKAFIVLTALVTLKMTVTKGIVSAIRTDNASGMSFIQSDAAISPGNSGGPLFNSKGQVVAISVAKFTGGGAEGLGLFIPLAAALDALGVAVKEHLLY